VYIEPTRTGYDGTEQVARRARFLILVQPESNGPLKLRAFVRKVALRQCGHFMMGRARIFGRTYVISGAYGSDGLPLTVPDEVYNHAVPVPAELQEAWNQGGGWNSAGSEAPAIRAWALETFPS
jgi:hypothetical protein